MSDPPSLSTVPRSGRRVDCVKIKLAYLAAAVFAVVAGVAAAFGCPVFRNPQAYITAGGAVGYLRHVIDGHRRR